MDEATAKASPQETLEVCSGGGSINPADAEVIVLALEIVARREIVTFCTLCLHNDHRNRHEPCPDQATRDSAARPGIKIALQNTPCPDGKGSQAALSP